MTMSNSFGITTSSFPAEQRGRAMGVIGTFVALGSVAGPALGGLVLSFLPWNYIFLINVPIGILAIIVGNFSLPKNEAPSQSSKLDWFGTGLFTLFIVSFFFAMLQGQQTGYGSPLIISSFIVALIAIVTFIIVEKRSASPLLDLSIFKYADFTLGLIAALFVFVNGFFYNVLVPYYLVNARGLSSGMSGALMSLVPLTMVVSGPIGGVLADKIGGAKIAVVGLTLLLISQILVVDFDMQTEYWYFVSVSILTGIGLGMFQSPNNSNVMSAVPRDRLGIAGSVNALARNLGMILGVSLSTSSLFLTMSMKVGKTITTYPTGDNDLFIYGMRVAFIISAALLVVADAIVIGRFLRMRKTK